jgi:hypothetical protein
MGNRTPFLDETQKEPRRARVPGTDHQNQTMKKDIAKVLNCVHVPFQFPDKKREKDNQQEQQEERFYKIGKQAVLFFV